MRMLKRMRWMIAPVFDLRRHNPADEDGTTFGIRAVRVNGAKHLPAESWILGLRLRGELETGTR
jgi:hypothetical protein